MKVYSVKDKKVVDIDYIVTEDGTFYVEYLNILEYGYKPVEVVRETETPDKYQRIVEKHKELKDKYIISYEIEDIDIKTAKEIKVRELNREFQRYFHKHEIDYKGVGVIDGGNKAIDAISMLIEVTDKEVDFRLADNKTYVKVTKKQLEDMKLAMMKSCVEAKNKQWLLEDTVLRARSVKTIKNVQW